MFRHEPTIFSDNIKDGGKIQPGVGPSSEKATSSTVAQPVS
jgi:hypothetical protein